MEYASNYGANAYNDRYYRDARNSAIMAGTTAVISAISLAKTVNDNVKKESQIKQNF